RYPGLRRRPPRRRRSPPARARRRAGSSLARRSPCRAAARALPATRRPPATVSYYRSYITTRYRPVSLQRLRPAYPLQPRQASKRHPWGVAAARPSVAASVDAAYNEPAVGGSAARRPHAGAFVPRLRFSAPVSAPRSNNPMAAKITITTVRPPGFTLGGVPAPLAAPTPAAAGPALSPLPRLGRLEETLARFEGKRAHLHHARGDHGDRLAEMAAEALLHQSGVYTVGNPEKA